MDSILAGRPARIWQDNNRFRLCVSGSNHLTNIATNMPSGVMTAAKPGSRVTFRSHLVD